MSGKINKKQIAMLTPEEQVKVIQEVCEELEWCIALNDESEGIRGLIIGNLEYVKEIVDQLENVEEYEVWASPKSSDDTLH